MEICKNNNAYIRLKTDIFFSQINQINVMKIFINNYNIITILHKI